MACLLALRYVIWLVMVFMALLHGLRQGLECTVGISGTGRVDEDGGGQEAGACRIGPTYCAVTGARLR